MGCLLWDVVAYWEGPEIAGGIPSALLGNACDL